MVPVQRKQNEALKSCQWKVCVCSRRETSGLHCPVQAQCPGQPRGPPVGHWGPRAARRGTSVLVTQGPGRPFKGRSLLATQGLGSPSRVLCVGHSASGSRPPLNPEYHSLAGRRSIKNSWRCWEPLDLRVVPPCLPAACDLGRLCVWEPVPLPWTRAGTPLRAFFLVRRCCVSC